MPELLSDPDAPIGAEPPNGFSAPIALRTRAGESLWVRRHGIVHEDAEGRRVMQGVLADAGLVMEKQMLEQLGELQRMEAVANLAGGIAHELNNALTVVAGHAGMLAASASADTGSARHGAAIQEASRDAAELVQQLLAFGQRQLLQLEPLNLNELLERQSTMLARVAGEDVQVELGFDTRLMPVEADWSQLTQVLLHLVVRGRAVTCDSHGVITIRTRMQTVAEETPPLAAGRYTTLSVADNGPPISNAQIERIFEPFRDVPFPPGDQGDGLSLAASYGIMRQLQGTLTATNDPVTTFTLWLPVGTRKPSPTPLRPVAGSLPPLHVLLCEDDASVRAVTREMLSALGHHVNDCPTPEAALAAARAAVGGFDVLLTDIVMPSMAGPELAVAVRATTERPLPVLFISGYAAGQRLPEGAMLLPKPFDEAQLRDALSDLLVTSAAPGAG